MKEKDDRLSEMRENGHQPERHNEGLHPPRRASWAEHSRFEPARARCTGCWQKSREPWV